MKLQVLAFLLVVAILGPSVEGYTHPIGREMYAREETVSTVNGDIANILAQVADLTPRAMGNTARIDALAKQVHA